MKKIITLLVMFIMAQSYTFAQSILQIKITDSKSKKSLSDITLNIKQSGKIIKTAITDVSGVATISDLQPGKYAIQITENADIYDYNKSVEIIGNGNQVLAISIQKKTAVLDEVTVTDKRSQINKTDATVAAFITKKEIEVLPVEGRDITKSLIRLPNVTISTLSYNEAPAIAINGLTGIYTNYLIDGMDNNERFLGNSKFNTPFGFTENVTVLTNNYSVEFGNTSNGIVNLATRSGTNKFSGEVFYVTRPGKIIDSKSAFAGVDLYGNPVKDGFQRQQLGVGLGGAIKKDKTFYYVNFEQTFDIKDNLLAVPALGVNETVRGKNSFTYLSGKIDQNWNRTFHSSLRANYGCFDIGQQGGGLSGGNNFPSSASTQKNRTYLIALKNDYTISGKLKGETNIQTSYFKWNYRDNPNFGKSGALVQGPTGATLATIGPNDYIFIDDEYTNQIQQKFTLTKGKHAFKAGVEFTTSSFSLLGAGNAYGYYTVRLTQAQVDAIKAKNLGSALDINDIPSNVEVREYKVDLDKSIFGTRQNVFDAYVEDNISVSEKLNVSLGLRFDYDNLSKAGGTKGDWNNIAPRTSFNYKIDDNNVIRGGYGIFYDKIKYSVTSDNLQFSNNSPNFKLQLAELQRLGILSKSADLDRITNPGNLRAVYSLGSTPAYLQGPKSESIQGNRALQSSTNFRIKNPDGYQNPYSEQFTIGYQRKLDEGLTFSIDLIQVNTNNLFRITNLNTASAYPLNDPANVVVRTTAAANLTRPVPIKTVNGQFVATIGGTDYQGISRDVFMTETKGKARYSAMNLMLQKTKGANDNISYRILYTLSRFKTDNEGINVRATDANNWDQEYGYGNNDRTHVVNGSITWYALKNLSLTPTLLFQSGQPITYYADATKYGGVSDLNGNGEGAYGNVVSGVDYTPGETRNGGGRLPSATTFDFSAKYKLSINHKPCIEISADIFNLLNTENLTGYNTGTGGNNSVQFGSASANTFTKRGTAPPRQFQFGLRYIW